MPRSVAVGLTLQPDEEYLLRLDPLYRSDAVDYFEVTPETTWHAPSEPRGKKMRLLPNGFSAYFARLGEATGKFFVGHGIGLSIGSADLRDDARHKLWFSRLAKDQSIFNFRWYTEHLGTTTPAGQAMSLPLPLLMNNQSAQRVAKRLFVLGDIFPAVGVENTAQYFLLGAPLKEPAFLNNLLGKAGGHLLLDLHNLYTMSENLGFSAASYLERLNLGSVIEIHLSGGSYSDGAWLPNQRVLRLDSHDNAVPEPVWKLFSDVLPRCKNLRGVTLERMEGTVTPDDVPKIAAELGRIREALSR